MDRFEDLRVFVRVVENGSLSAAADRLGIAKSAVSRRVAELEARLGVQLFRRTTRRLNLTDSGWSFYQRAVRILNDLEEAEAAVTQAHQTLRGTLRIAVPLSFGLNHLSPAIIDFMKLHTKVEFDIEFNERQVDLLQEGFDLAVRIAQLEDSTLIAHRLAPVRLVVCASPEYLARHKAPQVPADLALHPNLIYSNNRNPDVIVWRDTQGKQQSVQVPVRIRADNGEFLKRAAIAGEGVLIAPTFIVHEAIESGQLLPLLMQTCWPELAAYALYPQTRHLSQRVRALVDFLAERFAGVPYWDRCLQKDADSTTVKG